MHLWYGAASKKTQNFLSSSSSCLNYWLILSLSVAIPKSCPGYESSILYIWHIFLPKYNNTCHFFLLKSIFFQSAQTFHLVRLDYKLVLTSRIPCLPFKYTKKLWVLVATNWGVGDIPHLHISGQVLLFLLWLKIGVGVGVHRIPTI